MEEKNIVKKVCEEMNISQSDLARQLDVTTSAIAQWSSKEVPKMARKTLEYMLKSYKQEQQLNAVREFYKVLHEIEKN